MRNKALITLLVLLAVCLTAAHLRMPRSTQFWQITASTASARRGERLNVPFSGGTVDVNGGTAQELEALTGIGPVLAQEIIRERTQNGFFHYPEDLMNVKGIGEKTLNQMRDQLMLP